MNARRLAQVGLGLIGIWLVAQALILFVSFTGAGGMSPEGFLFVGVPFAVMLGFSYVLVFHNGSVARAIVPDPAIAIESDGADVPRVLFALMGVLLLSEAIPSVLNHVAAVAISANQEYSTAADRAGPILGLLTTLFRGAIGWYLIAKPGRLLELVRRPLPENAN